MTKKGKFITYFPTIAILIVSLCAFIPGIIASDFKTDLEVNKQNLTELRDSFDWMLDEAQYILSHDSNLYGLAWQEIQDALILDLEYSFLVADNQTSALVNTTYMNKIINHLQAANIIIQESISHEIWIVFNGDPTSDYHIGYSPSGYGYEIVPEVYFSRPLIINTTNDDFISTIFGLFYKDPGEKMFFNDTMNLLQTDYSDFLDEGFRWLMAPDCVFSLSKGTNLYNVTQNPVVRLGDLIIETNNEVLFLDELVSNLQTVVSIMTVATLLATAISGRLADRRVHHQVSVIRSDIKEDEKLIIKEVDKFSVVILILAILLAIGGLVFTLIPTIMP